MFDYVQDEGFTENDAKQIIRVYGEEEKLYLHGFEQYLLSDDNSIVDPNSRVLYQVLSSNFVLFKDLRI